MGRQLRVCGGARCRLGAAGDLQRGRRGLADGRAERTLTAINVFYIVRLLRGRHDSRTFDVVEISPNQAYLKHLLHELTRTIQPPQPWIL